MAKTDDFKELAKDVAMHIAASSPLYLSRDDVPHDVIEREKEIYKAQAAGRLGQVKDLLEHQKTLVRSGGDFIALNELIKLEEEKESDLISQYEKRQVDVKENMSHKFTVSSATKPEIKAWPKRTLVVFVSLLAAFAAGSFLLLLYEILIRRKKQSA